MGLVNTSTYRVETEMVARDQSSLVFGAIERSANAATRAVEQVKRGLGLLGVGFGFYEAKKHLIDFNASMENTRVTMAGMLAMFTKADMAQAWDRAGQSVDTFNKMAAKSPLTTKDLVDMAQMIERPLLQAGVRMSEIEKITFGAANAARAFGISSVVAAMDIQQALGAGVHIRDRFAIALLAQKGVGLTKEQFNALDVSKRAEALMKATSSAAIMEMAKKQGEDTFTGVISTLQDNLSLMWGRVGMGVFKSITHEIQGWNKWMEKNADTISRFEKSVSEGLVTGFKYVKSVVQFLVDHADTLLTIGKIWAVSKIGGMLGGGAGVGGGSLSAISGAFTGNSMMKELGQSLALHMRFPFGKMDLLPVFQKLAGLGGAAGALGPAGIVGIGYAAHELGEYIGVHRALTQAIDPTRVKLEELKKSMDVFDSVIQKTARDMEGEKGALGTNAAKQAIGVLEGYKMQLRVLEDVRAGRYKGAKVGGMAADVGQRELLASAGFDLEARNNIVGHPYYLAGMIGTLKSKVADVGGRTYRAAHLTDTGLESAMRLMSTAQKASIDKDKATELLMARFKDLLSSGPVPEMLTAALMTPEKIKEFLLKDALDPFKGASVNQNITNHISVEVSAKDPDRWLMEVDEKVQRKIRAPSQARGSIITRGGL